MLVLGKDYSGRGILCFVFRYGRRVRVEWVGRRFGRVFSRVIVFLGDVEV